MGNTFSFIIGDRIGIDGRFPSHDGRIALLRCTDETRGNDFVFERNGGQRGCTGLNLHTLPVGQQTKMRGFKLIIALIDVLYRIFTFTVRVSHVVGIGVLGSHDNASVTQCRSAGVSDLTTHSKFLQLLQGNFYRDGFISRHAHSLPMQRIAFLTSFKCIISFRNMGYIPFTQHIRRSGKVCPFEGKFDVSKWCTFVLHHAMKRTFRGFFDKDTENLKLEFISIGVHSDGKVLVTVSRRRIVSHVVGARTFFIRHLKRSDLSILCKIFFPIALTEEETHFLNKLKVGGCGSNHNLILCARL